MKQNYKAKIPIVLALNDRFVPYLSTFLLSIIDHASFEYEYNFMILNKDISDRNKRIIGQLLYNHCNFKAEFVNVKNRFKNYDLFVHEHFTLETYFRLLIPDILKGIDKALYLDVDTIILSDISELYNIDVSNYYLGAAADLAMHAMTVNNPSIAKELKDYVGIKNVETYFNAGVMVLNLKEFSQRFSSDYLLDIAMSKKWPTVDQDVLNHLCQENVKLIDMSWNVMFDYMGRAELIKSTVAQRCYDDYLAARKNPKIIHYAGSPKPWQNPESDFMSFFWKYARKSPFYEQIILTMAEYTANNI